MIGYERLGSKEGRMRTFEEISSITAVGCQEAGRLGLIETSLCCEICHSADERPMTGALGPCRVPLSDGRQASVCCSAKRQLLEAR